jgi:GTP pyrophosphokinase
MNLLYDQERKIDVEWEKSATHDASAPYIVKLTMEVEDRKGVIAEVSAKIAEINTNIKNMEARASVDDHHARIDVTIEIADLKHLERVIKSLKSVSGVLDVERTGRAS